MTDIVSFHRGAPMKCPTIDMRWGYYSSKIYLTKSIYYLNNNPNHFFFFFFSPQLTVSLPSSQAGQIPSLEMHPFWMVRFVFLNPHEV